MKRIMIIAVGVILIGLVAAASIALSPGTQSTTDGISAAELRDLQAVADQKGMSLQAAIDRYAWNNEFAAAVWEIRKAVPGSFTGAEIVDAGNAWVAFADSAPAAATSIIDNFTSNHSGISVEVRADKGFTEVELQKAIDAAHFAVFNSPEVLDANTYFDFATFMIKTNAQLESTTSDTVLDNLRAAAATKITDATRADILNSISHSVARFDGEALLIKESGNEHLAGEGVKIQGDDRIQCTLGFGVKDSSGDRGILTAGHCENDLIDDGHALHYEDVHEGEHGDFQWHTGPQSLSDGFYAGSATQSEVDERDVLYIGFAVVGQTLCRNGANSYRDCQDVYHLNGVHGNIRNLVIMEGNLSQGGDSGGPVYSVGTAYGIHMGTGMVDGAWRELFSKADRVNNAFPDDGVYIATD